MILFWGDWRDDSNYVSTGDDTFVAVGQGYSNIKDYESGENVWWLTKDGSYIPGSKDDVVVTHDYGSKSTKIGYETADGNIVNRIEISGLMKIDLLHTEQLFQRHR